MITVAQQFVDNPLLSAALDLAAKGIPVFPCNALNKRPHTVNGLNAATTDAEQIRRWWHKWPSAMIGVPTGAKSGAWVLDVDDPALFEAACRELGLQLPQTQRSETRKGYHLWWKWQPAHPIYNAQKNVKGWPFGSLPGAEVRGEGG